MALGLTPLARIVAHAEHAQEPAWFATVPGRDEKGLTKQAGHQPTLISTKSTRLLPT